MSYLQVEYCTKSDLNICSTNYSEILEILNKENKEGVVMGDFNIDLLQFSNDDFINNTFSQTFVPVITKPTRVTHTSSTLIDHIYTNNVTSTSHSGIIITDMVDHFGTFYVLENPRKNHLPKYEYKRSLSEQNIKKLQEQIKHFYFSDIYHLKANPDKAYNLFLSMIQSTYEVLFLKKKKKEITMHKQYIKKNHG